MANAAGREQRRYPRFKTREKARFNFAGMDLPCEIRDYCLNGFFLSFSNPSTLEALLPRLTGAPVQVEFVPTASNGRRFLVDAKVVHISPGGLGLYVEQMPAGAAQALNAATQAFNGPHGEVNQSKVPDSAVAMQQELSNLFRIFLDAVLQEFFSLASTRLTQASYELSSFIERSEYMQVSLTLGQQREVLQEAFFNTIRGHIQRIEQPEEMDSEAEVAASGLSLIDDEAFQDWLNLSAAINEVELATAIEFAAFERGYRVLIGTDLPRNRNPFSPELLCHCLRDVLQSLTSSISMRAILYRTFSQALTRHIVSFYQQMNQVLAPLQPVASVKHKKKETRPEAFAATESAALNSADGIQPNLAVSRETRLHPDRVTQLPESDASSVPENAEYRLDRILARINRPARIAAGASRFLPANASSDVLHAVSGSRPSLGELANRLRLESRQISRQISDLKQDAAIAEGSGGGQPAASQGELLAALSSLPLAPDSVRAGVEAALSDQVQAWLRSMGGNSARITPAYRQALDMAAGLIGQAKAEYVDGSQVELLLRRLERPLLKLAIEDEGFLSASDHPAREVVNLLDQFALATDDNGRFFDPKLQRFLVQMVDRIGATASEDPGIYVTVRDSLSKMLAPIKHARSERVARLQESYTARERLRQARARVAAELDSRFAGREVPELIPRLLDAGWRQYLVLLEMRDGMLCEEWRTGLEVLDQLADALASASRSIPQQGVMPLVHRIEARLASVNVDSGERATLMEDLASRLGGEEDAPPMRRFPLSAKAAAAYGEVEAEQQRLSEQLRVGEWWELFLDRRWVPMQCIWISSPPAHCAFASRSASDKLELALTDLARQTLGGLARVGGNLDLPLLDRSESALFDVTYHGMLRQAHLDSVTDLDNREGFLLKLGQIAAASIRQGRMVHALCILEFDQFRLIVNQHGPEAGVALSRQLAQELRKQVRPVDLLACFHEDTFALYLSDLALPEAERLAGELLRYLCDYRYQYGNNSYRIGVNLGLAEFSPTQVSISEAVRRADTACLTAKSQGRNRIQVFETSNLPLSTQVSQMGLAGRIDALMESGGLYLRAQKVIPISAGAGQLPYYEILLGITCNDGQPVAPTVFIPAVEGLQRAHEIDLWVLKQVFSWIRSNRVWFDSTGGFSINLSALSLSHPGVLDFLLGELERADLPADKLVFEITETAAIQNYNVARDFIRQVSGYGCKFSLDDFGSGYSSYTHLKNLQSHSLKIDGSFVKEMIQSPADFAMVKSMNDIGHSLGMNTVAEYVESAEILSKLREIGVDYAQGYIIHKPERIELVCSQRPS